MSSYWVKPGFPNTIYKKETIPYIGPPFALLGETSLSRMQDTLNARKLLCFLSFREAPMEIAHLLTKAPGQKPSPLPPGSLDRPSLLTLPKDSLFRNEVDALHRQRHPVAEPDPSTDGRRHRSSRNRLSFIPLPPLAPISTPHFLGGSPQSIPGYARLVKPITKPPAPKRFQCTRPNCGARFSQKGSLTRHVRARHDRLRPHFCRLCPKAFSEKWTLTVHVRNVHKRVTPHACGLCGARFGEHWNLRKHFDAVHKEVRTDAGLTRQPNSVLWQAQSGLLVGGPLPSLAHLQRD